MPDFASVGLRARVEDVKIAGVVSCVPAARIDNQRFVERFGEASVNDVVKMIGVRERRWAEPTDTTADFCLEAGRQVIERLGWDVGSIDGVIFASQTPDYTLPATACVMQHRLGLRTGSIAFDVNLGCSAYPYVLWLAATLIKSGAARRLLIAVGDTISKVVDPEDRATAMLFGDAGTVTALERCDVADESSMDFVLGSDGSGESNLIIPSGFRNRTAEQDPRLANRRLDTLYMDGGEIFNFTLVAVPKLIEATLSAAGVEREQCSHFLLHQANAFMLKHLTKKAKLPPERVPMNIDIYGNTSSASIPLLMTTKLADDLQQTGTRIALFGFGVGYSWAGAVLRLPPVSVVEAIER